MNMRSPNELQPERLYSLDAFRGFTMIWMISEGFGLRVFEGQGALGALAAQFEHVSWEGLAAWDLIQPFFMFIVGVAMPYSFAARMARGETWGQAFRHVLKRCALLIGFGLIARSVQAGKPVLDLINVLAQVSVTYLIAFLLLRFSWRVQAVAAFGLLGLTWVIYAVGGGADAWSREGNIGRALDLAILGKTWGGGYATLNCLPSAFNTIAGVLAGMLLRAGGTGRVVRVLAGAGAGLVAAGLALSPLVPVVKKIWTPSFALLSTGCCLLALLVFYWICDLRLHRKWASVFVIVGANSIFIYLFHEILGRWMRQTAPVFTGWAIAWWPQWGEVFTALVIIGFQIWVCYWLYQRRIFFKI
jgi:predicted acyltransferase